MELKLEDTQVEELTNPTGDAIEHPAELKPNSWYLAAKCVADRLVGVLLLVLSLPVMLIVAVLVKLNSHGPVLFSQTRIGKGRKPFKMYKFRTMCNEAEEMLASVLLSLIHI